MLQTFDTKGFEALFSWFKLVLSEPLDVPGGNFIFLKRLGIKDSLILLCRKCVEKNIVEFILIIDLIP